MTSYERDGVSDHRRLNCFLSRFFSGAHHRKHPSSASLTFVEGIHWWPVDSPHKRTVTRKMFPFVITASWIPTVAVVLYPYSRDTGHLTLTLCFSGILSAHHIFLYLELSMIAVYYIRSRSISLFPIHRSHFIWMYLRNNSVLYI